MGKASMSALIPILLLPDPFLRIPTIPVPPIPVCTSSPKLLSNSVTFAAVSFTSKFNSGLA